MDRLKPLENLDISFDKAAKKRERKLGFDQPKWCKLAGESGKGLTCRGDVDADWVDRTIFGGLMR